MNQQPFSDEEVAELRELLRLSAVVREEAEYKAALRLVIRTWKNVVIGAAAVIGAFLVLREQIKAGWTWFMGN